MSTKYDPRITPWQVREQDFPQEAAPVEKLRFLLRYAILAPSGHNSQPWRFSVSGDEIHVFANEERWLKVGDPDQVNMYIAIGCALENLLIAAEHFGYEHQVSYLPDPSWEEWVATVKLLTHEPAADGSKHQQSSTRDPALFGAIPNRHTNRRAYEDRPIPQKDLRQIRNCCVEEGIQLHVISDLDTKRNVNELLIRGHTTMIADPAFRRENAYWLGQGLFNLPAFLTRIVQRVIPHLKVKRSVFVVMDTRLVMSAPALVVLSARVNDRLSQVRVGQVFERVCLTATVLGLSVHPLSGAVDVPELRAQVATLLPETDVISQHVFRLGFAEPVKSFAQRRPVSEVLA